MTKPNYELMRHAYAVIDGIPGRNFNLDLWTSRGGSETSCGTIACGAGWLIRHPDFKAEGFRLVSGDIRGPNYSNNGYDYVARLFDIPRDEAQDLFRSADVAGSHKEIWQRRMRDYLRERGQLSSQLATA